VKDPVDRPRHPGIAGRIARAFIDSRLTPLLIVASILLGVMAIVLLPREEEPQIKVPMIDVLVAMPYLPPPSRARPTTTADGARGRVAWVEGGMLLPTLQHALVVDIGTQAGVRAGDRVTIYAADGTIAAKANVVRADPRSSTVRVVSQPLGALTTGLAVRVTEKLP
jgi:hypothetical protein